MSGHIGFYQGSLPPQPRPPYSSPPAPTKIPHAYGSSRLDGRTALPTVSNRSGAAKMGWRCEVDHDASGWWEEETVASAQNATVTQEVSYFLIRGTGLKEVRQIPFESAGGKLQVVCRCTKHVVPLCRE